MTFCFCVHNLCSDHKPMNYIMRSHDWGYTWSDPEDLSVKNPYFKDWPYCFGPGYGIQKQYKPHVGRLISCGHTVDRDNFKTQSMYCLYSDDHGITWTVGATLYGMPYGMGKKNGDFLAGEPQLVELPDGSIFVNIRNTHGYHCNCRIIAKSFDGGETFPLTNVTVDPNLVDPGCEGSLLLHKNIMFFSNPNSSAGRLNMTVKYSMDYGKHWNGDIHIYSDISEYSCLADIDENHVGVLYERDHYQQMGFAKIRLN
uniref:Sialidase-1 n=1 Tax=Saccoglossus kowalevskii TaxID=10224 RepID=A0ABM0MHL5_SACKO|nr:PREDICTED: sialidase-1-like [Saccoglossus kowalevskii]